MRKWLIRFLGGWTMEDYVQLLVACEQANKNTEFWRNRYEMVINQAPEDVKKLKMDLIRANNKISALESKA